MLPRAQLLQGCQHPDVLSQVLDRAEQALRTWEPVWTDFVAADGREEVERLLAALSEITLHSEGGWPQAERRRLLLQRSDQAGSDKTGSDPETPAPLMGLVLHGNFLFDPADPSDVQRGLIAAGAEANSLGDIWMRGDRGAQLIIRSEDAERWQGRSALIRSVEVQAELVALEQLQLPASRTPKQLSSVEASLRLDAVGSAGLGISRNRMAELIRAGAVRVNWTVITSPSRELQRGDRIRLEGRGELEIQDIQPTKRDRWRLVMERR
jgi:photosystem II S4 domain protein